MKKLNYDWLKNRDYPKSNGLKVFGTFVCGGGSTMGYKLAGFEHLGGVEIDKRMGVIYELNHNPKYFYLEDIRDFNNRTDLPDELYDLAIKYPNILFILEILFDFRNALKHSGQREETLLEVNPENLFEYKEIIYKSISVILRVKQKSINTQGVTIDDTDSHLGNAHLDLENEFGIDVVKQFPQELKDNLEWINFNLNGMDFEQNKSAVVNEVLTKLYSSIELLLRKKINDLPKNVSLGYIYNILVDRKNLSKNDLGLIEEVIKLRGHGNLSLEDVFHIEGYLYIKVPKATSDLKVA